MIEEKTTSTFTSLLLFIACVLTVIGCQSESGDSKSGNELNDNKLKAGDASLLPGDDYGIVGDSTGGVSGGEAGFYDICSFLAYAHVDSAETESALVIANVGSGEALSKGDCSEHPFKSSGGKYRINILGVAYGQDMEQSLDVYSIEPSTHMVVPEGEAVGALISLRKVNGNWHVGPWLKLSFERDEESNGTLVFGEDTNIPMSFTELVEASSVIGSDFTSECNEDGYYNSTQDGFVELYYGECVPVGSNPDVSGFCVQNPNVECCYDEDIECVD